MALYDVLSGAHPSGPPPTRRRGTDRAARKRKQRRRRKAVIVLLLALFVVGGGGAVAYFGLAPLVRQFMAPKDYVGSGSGEVLVKIPEGASGRVIARTLVAADVVVTDGAFLDAATLEPRSTSIQPGTYALRKQMSGAAALALLLDPAARQTTSVTITEGARVKDILDLLAKELDLDRAVLKKASTSDSIGLPAAAKNRPEGFLFPATYSFPPDVTETEVLRAMVKRAEQAYADLDIAPSKLRAVVIKASIVQAEAGNRKYMGPVARVLENRLEIDMPLQLDSTVSYATGRFGITTTPADRALDSGYNTYRYKGLPFGPISCPGEDALKAVLDPPPGQWLFFVTTNPDTGLTKFAVDGAGHSRNKAEFQAWLRAQ